MSVNKEDLSHLVSITTTRLLATLIDGKAVPSAKERALGIAFYWFLRLAVRLCLSVSRRSLRSLIELQKFMG